ncbi:Alpha-L-fucosidase [Mariniflexile rhizosphaerae]|uniref:alpha-L-fucosidase n=1 Tax=unclassified Mariniflexile TaxID=2643887 RepID=UPI000CC46EE1|nr:alpha-L-fucosidase [Mariniflexile sp. TRM1-10]AXP82774.1 Alpha-L-fucosidase [Mariniflexile sp. TRM1-10]PLB19030.1 MAG: Alpha-L-fucosidase [Flavobacteriaceae bacterium FS1-H7996/R]
MKNITLIVFIVSMFSYAQSTRETMETGPFEPNWESLKQYEVPKWFRDAKFGIWAHWGPQCQPEAGDWYARSIYNQDQSQYTYHLQNYGHPSEFGFKDVINEWKAENWNPEKLVALYKRAGAKYFFAMGNHHDNLDMWDSKHQEWNSVDIGPKKNILAGWAEAAKKNDLPFGVSIHSAHAWRWYESAQMTDETGTYAGIPYDGKLTKKDGEGKWWEGLDPQNLYVQNHLLSQDSKNINSIHNQWGWENGATPPSEEYCLNFYNRTVDMINKFNPDLLYFDDTALPLWPVSKVGLDIAAHYYNSNMKLHNGKLEAVLFGKILTDEQKECMVWDVERGAPDDIQEKPWQSCTCIGGWHYDRGVYNKNAYKSPKKVMQMLVDIVSKNGNLLLNIPVRGDGSIDEKELKVVEGITQWMDINSECIYETRPWHIYGEGPKAESANPINAQGFNEGKGVPYSSKDIRFTKKGDILYAVIMECPENNEEVIIKSLATDSPYYNEELDEVEILGGKMESFKFNKDGLSIKLSNTQHLISPIVLKIF